MGGYTGTTITEAMMIVIMKYTVEEDTEEIVYVKEFDRKNFMKAFWQFAFPCLYFLLLGLNFLRKLHGRFHRVYSYLCSQHTGDFYFYNEETGMSVTDEPEDYIPNANPREKEMNAPKLGKRDLESLDQRTFLLKQEAKKMLEKFVEAGFSDEEIEEMKELHGMVLVLGRSMLDQLCMKPKKKKYQDQLDRSREVFKNAVRECADAVTQRVNKATEESANSDYIEELRDDLRQWDAMEHAEGL